MVGRVIHQVPHLVDKRVAELFAVKVDVFHPLLQKLFIQPIDELLLISAHFVPESLQCRKVRELFRPWEGGRRYSLPTLWIQPLHPKDVNQGSPKRAKASTQISPQLLGRR